MIESEERKNERGSYFMQMYGTLVYPGHPPELQREILESIEQYKEVKRQSLHNARQAMEEAFKTWVKD